ncbi:DUF6233 domain-containing protein [Streptomyces sp. SID2119]|uniref:DUF6233 domain-containing protein n=1 Tax=Streptomyces sp. SID2119 TaxID=2690253 RepID=UPI001367C889|nr:DUF6233 domain-containing protein [Streptomyces sp. SID2119]MYW30113.1 hypothetical protein [Streptomyces sp. SID2119]
MFDLPPDLPRLRTLRTWYAMWLGRIDEAIQAAEEKQRAEQLKAQRQAAATPDWIVELGIGQGAPPVDVHIGGCPMAGKRRRTITRNEAVQLISQGINPCTHCRPDTELGLLE